MIRVSLSFWRHRTPTQNGDSALSHASKQNKTHFRTGWRLQAHIVRIKYVFDLIVNRHKTSLLLNFLWNIWLNPINWIARKTIFELASKHQMEWCRTARLMHACMNLNIEQWTYCFSWSQSTSNRFSNSSRPKYFSPVSHAFVREKRFCAYLPHVNVNFNFLSFSQLFHVYLYMRIVFSSNLFHSCQSTLMIRYELT